MKAKLFFSFFYFSNCALDCDQAKNNEKLKYPKTLQNVYCEVLFIRIGHVLTKIIQIFAKIELEDSPEFHDLSQESDFTRLAVRIQRTGDPYTLRGKRFTIWLSLVLDLLKVVKSENRGKLSLFCE